MASPPASGPEEGPTTGTDALWQCSWRGRSLRQFRLAKLAVPIGLRSLALIEVMDQFDPALRQRLTGDLIVVGPHSLTDQSQECRCVLHGVLQDVQAA